ncbi:hypothetical protein GH714_033634 [Hevea brasiliensis]|uniref:non-specific serine/threonine protein kinase n=1 Tax=Hevea brasiliensis TaxID=3981 RepID=A0A6A6LL54_HEVBR|nr:hypothetical protein GH714_033634 [Hevea brasiliensis]
MGLGMAKLIPFFIFLTCLFGYGNSDSKLPKDEADALRAVISKLRLMPAAYSSPSNCPSAPGSVILCNCSYPDNTCHVTEINTDGMDSSGGVIDNNISRLKYLKVLNLGNSQLSGYIPWTLGDLPHLETLNLYKNLLTGFIPSSLGNLSSLKTLRLHGNVLSGQIPSALGSLSNLEILRLEQNQLSGSIPMEIGNLTNLKQLRLDENQLVGALPSELGNLVDLSQLDVSSNYLTGELSQSYAKLKSLNFFAVAGNSLTGPIPKFIARWTSLTNLYLIGNDFEGGLPHEIFDMSNLEYLLVSDLRNSSFSFPQQANMTNIYTLVLRNCSISGYIPEYIGNWSSLEYLDLSFNYLTGQIPESFKNLSLNEMFLTRNLLNGKIPLWIPNIVQSKGDFSDNNFTMMDETNPAQKLNLNEILNMRNEYCGSKSKHNSLFINCGGPQLDFEGDKYDQDKATSNFFVSPNRKWAYSCSGDSSLSTSDSSDFIQNVGTASNESLYKSARLCPVALTYYAFCLKNGNYIVKLLFMETDSSSWKRVFDVYIQGERVLKNFDIKQDAASPIIELIAHVHGNLLEINLYWAGKGSIYNPPASNGPLLSAISVIPRSHSEKLSPSQITGITLASVLIPLLLLAFIWKMGWLRNKELDETTINVSGKSYTVRQIINATRNFSPKMRIGEERFGEVYKAELPDRTILAVKRISNELKERQTNELQKEIFNLKSLRHDNLVQLFGLYSKKNIRLLVYEYMERGTLHQALFESQNILDWKLRFEICLGIARGLKYLHEEIEGMKIVHGNLRPSTIMLDRSWIAKISDFGLATFYDDEPFMLMQNKGSL